MGSQATKKEEKYIDIEDLLKESLSDKNVTGDKEDMVLEYLCQTISKTDSYDALQRKARDGDTYAYIQLASWHISHAKNIKDYCAAYHYALKASKHGYVESYYILGQLYLYGTGCIKNVHKAIKYLDIFVRFYEHAMTMLIKKYPMRYFGVSKDACEWIKHFNIQAEGTLYNAMNLDEIELMNKFDYRKKLGLTENDFIITYVGRIVGGKGLLELTSAVNEIRKEYSNVYLVVAGDGPYMKELVKHKTPYITLLGRIPYSDVISLLSSVDTFCLPSETEGFPTSVLEAVACKCYVITTTAGGSKELITNSQLGTIMKDNSSKSIEEALRAIIDHKESRIEASEKCYVRLKEKFTWDAVAAKVEDIFEI